jgi:hypothetical protein
MKRQRPTGWDVPPRRPPTGWDVQPTQLAVSNPLPNPLSVVNADSYFGQRGSDLANPLLYKGDSTRNTNAIQQLTKDPTRKIKYLFFIGGHSCMTTPSAVPVDAIPSKCASVFFNYPGEVSTTNRPNRQIFQLFERYMTQFHRAINGSEFLHAADYVRQEAFIPDTPLSVYIPNDELQNLTLFAPGTLYQTEISHTAAGPIVIENPACFFVLDIESKQSHDLGTVFADNFPIMTVQPGNETNVYSYLRRDGQPVTLANIYTIIEAFMTNVKGTLDQAALACFSCRCSSDIVISRQPSIPRQVGAFSVPIKYGGRGRKASRNLRKKKRIMRNTKKK